MRIFCALALLHAVSPRYGFPSPESGTVIVTDRYTDLPFTFTPRNSRCVGVHATPFVAAANYSGHAGADLLTKAVARAMYVELLRLLDAYAQSGDACPS